MPCKQGDVVLVRFPFTDYRVLKKRPAVVVSADWFNQDRDDYLLAAVTSQIPMELARDDFRLSQGDLDAAGLPRESLVKSGKIMALQKSMIDRTLGRLPDKTLHSVLERVSEVLGLL
ncbi:MAG TPA: type II toxin-antitoxin system PemK/MazF family toxin [Chloroflexota bacterium]|nr:type II toxin-antitoxin system PemK/MazF family toxin [Chloroflexota bacterium]